MNDTLERVIDDETVCDCCQYPAKGRLKDYGPTASSRDGQRFVLCEICATTFLSSAVMYPRLYGTEIANISGGIGYIGNLLFDEIRKRK